MELHVKIFLSDLEGIDPIRESVNPTDRVAQLRTVCTRWWRLINNSPTLWSSVAARRPGWKQALRLSNNALLDVEIYPRGDISKAELETFTEQVLNHLHRWRSLDCSQYFHHALYSALAAPLPHLRTLKLLGKTNKRFQFSGGPRLREIDLICVNFRWTETNLTALETLKIASLKVRSGAWGHELRRALAACRRLRSVTLTEIDTSDQTSRTTSPAPELSSLSLHAVESLWISQVAAAVTVAFLPSSATMPSLVKLNMLPSPPSSLFLETFIGNGSDGLLPTIVKNGVIERIKINVWRGHIRMEAEPRWTVLNVDLPWSDWGQDLAEIGKALKDCAPVQLALGSTPGLGSHGIRFLETFRTLETIWTSEVELAVPITKLLTKKNDSAPLGFACPKLTKITFSCGLPPKDSTSGFARSVKSLAKARPDVALTDRQF